METIKLSGNKFPVAESLRVEAEKQAEQAESPLIEQSAGTEYPLEEQDLSLPLPLVEQEEEKNEKRTLIRKIMRYRSTFPTELLDLSHKSLII